MSQSSTVSCGERDAKDAAGIDIEQQAAAEGHLHNTTVHHISWKGITVTVKDRETKLPKTIVDNVDGIVEAGWSKLSPFPFLHRPWYSLPLLPKKKKNRKLTRHTKQKKQASSAP